MQALERDLHESDGEINLARVTCLHYSNYKESRIDLLLFFIEKFISFLSFIEKNSLYNIIMS